MPRDFPLISQLSPAVSPRSPQDVLALGEAPREAELPASLSIPQHAHILVDTQRPNRYRCDVCQRGHSERPDASRGRAFTCMACDFDCCLDCARDHLSSTSRGAPAHFAALVRDGDSKQI